MCAQAGTITFDDLPALPAVDGAAALTDANGGSPTIAGVTFVGGVSVIGDAYRVDIVTPGPTFGIPHSGHFFITNHSGTDNIQLLTTQTLLGAWFGQNEYYGFGGGADQVTVTAFGSGGDLASVVLDLPNNFPGLPEPLSFMDTIAFAGLAGITGYRIDRHEIVELTGNWVADDFVFLSSAVPEPGSWLLAAVAAALLGAETNIRRGARWRVKLCGLR